VQTLIISGNLGSDAVTRQTQKGDKVTSFNVGSKQGFGDSASTNWFRCTIWGERGDKIAQYLLKGVKVFVTGELTIGSYEGKPQYEIRVNEIEWERRNGDAPAREAASTRSAPIHNPDLDDDVPF
jgi:single-strand DNA-binding protein